MKCCFAGHFYNYLFCCLNLNRFLVQKIVLHFSEYSVTVNEGNNGSGEIEQVLTTKISMQNICTSLTSV